MSSLKQKFNPLKNLKSDFPASIVVFLVAMPLCLGIALASGAPLFAGIIAGVVGGVVVGTFSGSTLGVSGPAAGLTVIVLTAIQDLGSYEAFLVAVVIAGSFQLLLGYARGGIIAYYFPSSLILGMLAGIGIMIFLQQIPLALGLNEEWLSGVNLFSNSFFSDFVKAISAFNSGALIITTVSLAIMMFWESSFIKKIKVLHAVPGPLLAVVAGILLSLSFSTSGVLSLSQSQMVNIPITDSAGAFFQNFTFPDFAFLGNPQVYVTAAIIAVVASLETLLSVEAVDKIDPNRNVTPTNRELKAQGLGNMISGLIGGLPVTQVIVRSSVNVQSGGKSKASTVMHGFFLLLAVAFIPMLLNMIPLATLAAILMVVGYKLAKPALFKKMYKQGKSRFITFLTTIAGIVFADLLIGLAMGFSVSLLFVLYNNYKIPYTSRNESEKDKKAIKIALSQELTFLNKASILKSLDRIPDNSTVEIDASNTVYMDHDVKEIIEDFIINARHRNINLTLIDFDKERSEERPYHLSISYNGDGVEEKKIEKKYLQVI